MATKTKQNKTKQTESKSTLYSIYGARFSKSGKRVNVSLVKGNDDDKEWACVSVKLDNPDGKIQAQTKNGFAYLKIPMLVENEEKQDTLDF